MKDQKQIGTPTVVPVHTHRDNWEVMRPFVKFAWGALKVVGLTLIAIVKMLPALKPADNSKPNQTRTIKIH